MKVIVIKRFRDKKTNIYYEISENGKEQEVPDKVAEKAVALGYAKKTQETINKVSTNNEK